MLNIDKEDLLEYNDPTTDAQLKDGQLIFIQRKKLIKKLNYSTGCRQPLSISQNGYPQQHSDE